MMLEEKDLSGGKLKVSDLSPEAALGVNLIGLLGTKNVSYDKALQLSRSLGIPLDQTSGGYETGSFAAVAPQKELKDKGAVYAPLTLNRNQLSIVMPEDRQESRVLTSPKTEWDCLQGLLLSYRRGDVPLALSYLDRHCSLNRSVILALLEVWKRHAPSQELAKEAELLQFGLSPKQ